jgi:maltooligosyltrehalose trehalohydrolase
MVREGRQRECEAFGWTDAIPDPQSTETFRRSMLNRVVLDQRLNRILWNYHRELIKLRKTLPALSHLDKASMCVTADAAARTMCVERWHGTSHVSIAFNLSEEPALIETPLPEGNWTKQLDSAGSEWNGPGSTLAWKFQSHGKANWELPPMSLVLFSYDSEAIENSPVINGAIAL